MRVLIACEFTGVVREAFRKLGHDAVSCDLLESEQPGDGLHYQGDVKDIWADAWDLMIAFPPCTHLCSSGAQYWPQKRDSGLQQAAVNFVLDLKNAPVPRIAIENPVGILSRLWRKPDQIIHPFQFGEPYMKKTCLWLKNLPQLAHSDVIKPEWHWHGGCRRGGKKKDGTRTPAKLPTMLKYLQDRSRSFQGIANAMAQQWGPLQPLD